MEIRRDPVTQSWVVSGQRERSEEADTPCPFDVPAIESAKTIVSWPAEGPWQVRVVPHPEPLYRVENDPSRAADGIYDKMGPLGAHEVVVETPQHDKRFSQLSDAEIERVLYVWGARIADLKKDARFKYVTVFKNQGAEAGQEWTHAHSQVTATIFVPRRIKYELVSAHEWYKDKERCVFCDIVRQESQAGARLVMETDRFIVIEPYAARFPFETWIIPKRHDSHFEDAGAPDLQNLAWVLRSTLRKLDKTLEKPAYNFLVHTAPVQESPMPHYHWHIEIMPRLTKVAGFEWGSGFYINPTPPEESAQFLREAGLG